MLEQKVQVYAEDSQSLSQMGELWLVLALLYRSQGRWNESLTSAGVPMRVLSLLLIPAILSAEAALQNETKCYNPALVLQAHFRPP